MLRGALNVLTDDNYLSVSSSHLCRNLQARIPGAGDKLVNELLSWVNDACAVWLQEELDSGESTEEMDSGESTNEMDSGGSIEEMDSGERAEEYDC